MGMGSPAVLAFGLLALAAAGALAQPAGDVITVLPDFEEWRNLTMFSGEGPIGRRTHCCPAGATAPAAAALRGAIGRRSAPCSASLQAT